MNTNEAARIFHDWTYTEGLMVEGPVAQVTSTAADFAQINPISDKGKALLRAKLITAIGEGSGEIVVFTKRAAPHSKRALELLPTMVDDIGIRYRQGVQLPIGGSPSTPFGGPAYSVRHTGTSERYACGSSISVGNFRDAGTLACLVRDQHGALYGLSNNHVSGGCSFAASGLPILAPGVADVMPNSMPPFTIGFHRTSLTMIAGAPDNVPHVLNLDAAIFSLADPELVSSYQGAAYDTPVEVGDLVPGLTVEKVGRTTGHTTGSVISRIYGAHGVNYGAPQYGFNGVVFFEPMYAIVGNGGVFSAPGDSGSLITSVGADGVRRAVGLVVAGMNDGMAIGGTVTIALPLRPILEGLGVQLVAGHNV